MAACNMVIRCVYCGDSTRSAARWAWSYNPALYLQTHNMDTTRNPPVKPDDKFGEQ